MQNIDYDLRSVQEVRDLARLGQIATEKIANYTEDQIDRIDTEYGSRCRRKCCFTGTDGSRRNRLW